MPERVLIVEDDPDVLAFFADVLEREGYEALKAGARALVEEALCSSPVDLVVTDLRMPGLSGLDVLRIAKDTDPQIAVILVTGFPEVETAVQAFKASAADYLTKPVSGTQLAAAVRDGLTKRRATEAYELSRGQLRRSTLSGMVGRSGSMLALLGDIRKVAPVGANVLILGESGVGKELVARAIHENSPRHGKPFFPLNCAAIPEQLLEAELFGHERGAFTGAEAAKEGLLEAASGGTLFLDELCELSLPLQAKLLRALEEGQVRRLGGRRLIPFDVRFIAATNRDIHEELRGGRFREDLFFRIDVIEIAVPPLRQRRQDIPILAIHFLEACSAHYRKKVGGIAQEAVDLLTRYDWPGNVRELRNAIERAVAYAKGPIIAPGDLPETILKSADRLGRHSFHEWREETLGRLEREFLEKVLRGHAGNVTRAAGALSIHRSTLHRLIRRHNLPST